jgi:membrane associated rhomboid family serine protease
MTPAVRAIVFVNVGLYVLSLFTYNLIDWFGLTPEYVLVDGYVWQIFTYQFLHADVFHILFNMLWVWMFGVDLERRWGTVAFAKYYLIVGTTAGVATMLVSLLPVPGSQMAYEGVTIGASGAGYGLMMAWAIVFPHRMIYFFGIVPIKAWVFALIAGAISLSQAMSAGGESDVAHVAHLGGLAAGWLYLKTPRLPKRPKPSPRPDYIRRVH